MRLLVAAIISACCFTLDRISKSWAKQHLTAIVCKPFLPGALNLVLVTNTGGAFGIACGNNSAMALLSGSITIGILAWALLREKYSVRTLSRCSVLVLRGFLLKTGCTQKAHGAPHTGHARRLNAIEWCGVGFLIGGALGNLWDRLTLGYVVDFLNFAFINFPVFNLSDVFVDIGIGLIVLGSIVSSKVLRK